MCRHAAYIGQSVSLDRFLLEPAHGLVVQAYRPREMLTAEINADGFGFGWYLADGTPGCYTNPMPIWSDSNLVHIGRALTSRLWLGNVRSATPGQPINQANTHPFCAGGMLFSHNGFLHDYARGLRHRMRRALPPEIDAEIRGGTDSEHLFGLLRGHLASTDGSIETALRALFAQMQAWLEGSHGLFNFIIADGRRVYATRHAIGHAAPSLYLGRDWERIGEGWLVASEPMTESDWQPVPEGHLVVLEADRDPVITPL